MSDLVLSLVLLGQVTIPAVSPRFDEIKLGESTVFWEGPFEVEHVIDDTTMVVTYYYRPHIRLWVLKGWSTKNLADGDTFRVDEGTKVDGTHRWGCSTLRVISPAKNWKRQSTPTDGPASPNEDESRTPLKWINTSYDTEIYRLGDGRWAEREAKTGKIKWYFKELAQEKEFVELLNLKRDQTYRLSEKRLELKKDGTWEWLSDGHWEKK